MNLLFLTFLAPLIGFVLLAFGRRRLSENQAALIGVGSIGVSFAAALSVGIDFFSHPPEAGVYQQLLWTWMRVGDFAPTLALHLDGLSLTMLGVITGVGFLIHLYASWYMRGENGYERFFAYMNLFVASMLFLVLGDNLLFLYMGWEGVGLCSYLLIGFYYQDPANGYAARKAFVVTRIGDTFMAIGLFMLYREFGTLNIHEILTRIPLVWSVGSPTAGLIALLLLLGACGKSAQLPLQTWLPDAMAGPTPVSALIHAATMVTAGVYLIARTHTIFEYAPAQLHLVGLIGAATLLVAGMCALVQTDIKRVLAYSTMSQIGYMFLALGCGAWQAAVFHLMTHAFFKALLFLASGSVILACHHEQNIFKMGGLRKALPVPFWSFVIGGSALAALPFITAGFYSKDMILWQAYATGNHDLFWAGLVGALLTSVYTFRLIYLVFFGEEKTHAHKVGGLSHNLPLLVLMVLSTFVGGMIHPPLAGVLPETKLFGSDKLEHLVAAVSILVALTGVVLGALLYRGERKLVKAIGASLPGRALNGLWLNAWGFDWLYDALIVKPFVAITNFNRRDGIDWVVTLIPGALRGLHDLLALTENGRLRWYAATFAGGAVAIVAALVL